MNTETNKKAVVLVSGGLDSATTLAMAIGDGFQCFAIAVDYGQRHRSELDAAKRVTSSMGVSLKVLSLDLRQIGGSALTDNIDVPVDETEGIPVTYVPARNTIMLSLALGYAEVLGANDLFIGVNAVDYSGYPDCRPEFIQAFQTLARLATKTGIEGADITIHTPLIYLTKSEIIKKGAELGVNYSQTVSCYQANEQGKACGKCDSCRIRRDGFKAAGVPDSTRYA
ncbi:MAG TPA: 7-cyano-7-deazaguanine synthase QueC [Xanthomonadales bacterium]|nr:7-cyano-7-deazaguanine synthase QueC [Xanthomonadales bacterium]